MWQPQHRISEGADHPGMAYLRNVERTQRPPDRNAQQNGGGHRRRFCRCRPVLAILELMCPSQGLGRQVVADVLGLNVSNEADKSKIKRSTLVTRQCPTRREDKEFRDVVEVPNPESSGAGKCGTDTLRLPNALLAAAAEATQRGKPLMAGLAWRSELTPQVARCGRSCKVTHTTQPFSGTRIALPS
jgi:hypothetical protein